MWGRAVGSCGSTELQAQPGDAAPSCSPRPSAPYGGHSGPTRGAALLEQSQLLLSSHFKLIPWCTVYKAGQTPTRAPALSLWDPQQGPRTGPCPTSVPAPAARRTHAVLVVPPPCCSPALRSCCARGSAQQQHHRHPACRDQPGSAAQPGLTRIPTAPSTAAASPLRPTGLPSSSPAWAPFSLLVIPGSSLAAPASRAARGASRLGDLQTLPNKQTKPPNQKQRGKPTHKEEKALSHNSAVWG